MAPILSEKRFHSSKPKADRNTVSADVLLLPHAPPHDRNAEQGVVGVLLIDPLVVDDVVPLLSVDDFYFDANRRIDKQLVEMHKIEHRTAIVRLHDRTQSRNHKIARSNTEPQS